jgi:AGZA family xanthine/uracil permease-like MFS transporter
MKQGRISNFFRLQQNRSSVKTEVLAGVTSFSTMSYVIFLNPAILAESGMDYGAVFVATCAAAAIGTLIMGLLANYPIALAPGMGLTAFFTYEVVISMGNSWQTALGAVFVSGILFIALSALPVREWIINSIPKSQKLAISAGIGLFLALIALKNAGIIVDHPATLISVGNLAETEVVLAASGFLIIAALDHLRVPGAIIIGMLTVAAIGIVMGITEFAGVASLPPSIAPTLAQMDIVGALQLGMVSVIIAFLFVDVFDTTGTLIGVGHRAGLLDANGRLPRLRRALFADSTATVVGATLGTSPVTCYIESAAGVKAGGRTGLTAVIVAVLFFCSLFFAPLAASVATYATAPALLFVACAMTQALSELDWSDSTEAIPAMVTALSIPFTFSIATGIGFGLISYAVIRLLSGRSRDTSFAVYLIAAIFLLKFAFGGHT